MIIPVPPARLDSIPSRRSASQEGYPRSHRGSSRTGHIQIRNESEFRHPPLFLAQRRVHTYLRRQPFTASGCGLNDSATEEVRARIAELAAIVNSRTSAIACCSKILMASGSRSRHRSGRASQPSGGTRPCRVRGRRTESACTAAGSSRSQSARRRSRHRRRSRSCSESGRRPLCASKTTPMPSAALPGSRAWGATCW